MSVAVAADDRICQRVMRGARVCGKGKQASRPFCGNCVRTVDAQARAQQPPAGQPKRVRCSAEVVEDELVDCFLCLASGWHNLYYCDLHGCTNPVCRSGRCIQQLKKHSSNGVSRCMVCREGVILLPP